jgi:class 3 adenylate cyclase
MRGAHAGAGEIVVSRAVKDALVGARLDVRSLGSHRLKGVPGEWELFELLA